MKSSENSEKSPKENIIDSTNILSAAESFSEQEKPVEPELTPVAELYKQQGISRTTAYRRLEHLQIKPWKKGTRLFLNREQVQHMNGLHKHYQKTGKFDGFPIPSPTEPWQNTEPLQEEPKPEESSLAVRREVAIERSTRPSTPEHFIPIKMSEDIQNSVDEKVPEEDLPTATEDIEQANLQAQHRAAKKAIALETLTLLCESTGNFGEFQETVEAHKELCRTARRRGQAGMQDFFAQKISQLITGRNASTQSRRFRSDRSPNFAESGNGF